MNRIRSHSAVLLSMLALGGGLVPRAADAQVGVPARTALQLQPRIGVGFTANVPDQLAGGSLHFLTDRLGGMGLYLDVKLDMESPADEEGFTDTVTAAQVEANRNHRLFDLDASYTSVNVALMRALSPQFTVYAGGGYSDATEYKQYQDPTGTEGRLGYYWVEDPDESGPALNLLGGAFFQLGKSLALQLGGETRPAGFTVGVSYLVPLRR